MGQKQTEASAAMSPIPSSLFKNGMRRLASGVVVIATAYDNQRFGLAATAVTSISAEPPTLMICVNRSSSAHEPIIHARCFTVNLLREEDRGVADLFGSSENRDKRFDGRDWITLKTGAPALAKSLASFDCAIVQSLAYFSHTLFFGQVVDLKMFTDEIKPLLYWDGSYQLK
jgi:flavin reductase